MSGFGEGIEVPDEGRYVIVVCVRFETELVFEGDGESED